MTALCDANRAAGSTKRIFSVSLIIPILIGLITWGLASGAAPERPLRENYISLIGLAITGTAILVFPVPYIFRWNWEAKYYGSFLFPFATTSALGICPALCIIMYGNLTLLENVTIVVVEIFSITWRCWKIIKAYSKIYSVENLFNSIYVEKIDAIYYLLQSDKLISEKLLNIKLCPPTIYFLLPMLMAFLSIPFHFSISKIFGAPFVHIFMAMCGAPLNLLFLGICTKCWLVFYCYPNKIKRKTGKLVYVDMSSRPSNPQFYFLKKN